MTPVLLDTVVGIVILLSIVIAFFRGFIKEVLTIVNLGLAAGAAYIIGPQLIPTCRGWLGIADDPQQKLQDIWGLIPPQVMATFMAYAIVYFGVFLVLTLAGMAISTGAKAMGLGPVDRVLGMLFGAARGFLLVFLIYLPFGFFMKPQQLPEWARESVSVRVLDDSYRWADEYLKKQENTEERVDALRGKFKEITNDVLPKKDGESGEEEILRDDEKKTPR